MRHLKNQSPDRLVSGLSRRHGPKAVMLTTALLLFSVPALAETPAAPQPATAPASTFSAAKSLEKAPGHSALTADFMKSGKQKFTLSQSGEATTEFGQPATSSPLASAPLNSLSTATPLARAALDQGAALYATSPLTKAATATTGAPVPTTCPNTYDKLSEASNSVLGAAYEAIGKRDIASLQAQLPGLQTVYNAIPLKALAPEVCNDHANIYTVAQFAKLNALKDAGVPNGVPANLPLVKQPELPFTSMAFAIGWTKYELQDFDGSFLALAKGLIIDPSSTFLANEYIATLFQMKRYTDVVGFTETFLTNNYILADEERSDLFANHGWALIYLGYGDAAEKSFMISLYYNNGNKAAIEGLTLLKDAKAKAGKS